MIDKPGAIEFKVPLGWPGGGKLVWVQAAIGSAGIRLNLYRDDDLVGRVDLTVDADGSVVVKVIKAGTNLLQPAPEDVVLVKAVDMPWKPEGVAAAVEEL